MATPVRRIVNASPLILLAKVGQLDLPRAGYRKSSFPTRCSKKSRTWCRRPVLSGDPADDMVEDRPCASNSSTSGPLEPRSW